MGVVVYSLIDEIEMAKDSLRKVRAVKPDYDVDDFFSVYAFRKDDDIRRLTHAFLNIESRLRVK